MTSSRAILRAMKAVNAPYGGRATPVPQGNAPYLGATSPVVQQLDVASGYASGYGPYLPRPPATFTQGAFGPFSPVLPVPVDTPDASGRAEPRREQYQVGWDLPTGEPGAEGIKLATFGTLRTLADLYSVARACIQTRKAEVRALEWDIMPTTDAAKAHKNDKAWYRDFGERRAKAMRFFRRPDPDYFAWNTFIDALLEEIFVFDALSLYVKPKRGRGMRKGLLGSDLDCLQLISGPTIRPLYDIHGGFPRPPAPAYQQYLYGVPRSDFMQLVTGRDIEEAGFRDALWGQFRGDQLLYLPMVPRRWTPYGFPPIERALIPVMSGLQKQGWALDYFREGTVPAVYMSPGDETMTPNQIRELQDTLNAFAGDPAMHHKIIVLPPGTKVEPQRGAELADQFDEVIMNQVCMAFDVMPMELGISPKVSTTQSPGAANQMAKQSQSVTQRKSTKPLLMFLSDIMDAILQDVCGQDDMKFVFEGTQEEEDEKRETDLLVEQINAGLRSIDEGRDKLNLQPWGLPETSNPVTITPNGPVPFGSVAVAPGNPATGPVGQPGLPAPAQPGQLASAPKPTPRPTPKPAATGAEGDTPSHDSAEAADAASGSRSSRGASGGAATPSQTSARPTDETAKAVGLERAVTAELEALTRHLRKGREVSTWVPRHLPQSTLAAVSRNLATGLAPQRAVELGWALTATDVVAKAATTPAAAASAEPPPTADPPGWPAWAVDTALVALLTPRLLRAFRRAAGGVATTLARVVSGEVNLTRASLLNAVHDALAQALGPVLADLWRQGFQLGDRAAAAVLARGPLDYQLPTAGALPPVSAAAERWALRNVAEVLHGIATTNADRLVPLKRQAPDEAEVLRLLEADRRTQVIARTEVPRAVAAGAVHRYGIAGVTKLEWLTEPGACPICHANRDAGPVDVGDVFPSGDPCPPAHPHCFVAGTMVEGPSAVAATERVYEGDLTTIVLQDGRELTGTPNHPVLTPDGWVALGDLHEGSQVLRARDLDAALDPDHRQAQVLIEQVASLLAEAGRVIAGEVPGSPVDFHGDGVAGHEVHVVRAVRNVGPGDDAESLKQAREDLLVKAVDVSLASLSTGDEALEGALPAASRGVGSIQHGGTGGRVGLLPAKVHACGHITYLDPVVSQDGVDRVTPDVEVLGETLGGLPGDVALTDLLPVRPQGLPGAGADRHAAVPQLGAEGLVTDLGDPGAVAERLAGYVEIDRVVEVRVTRDWVGHVYNLETAEGWYAANTIITHNCRCGLAPTALAGDLTSPAGVTGALNKVQALRRHVALDGEVSLDPEDAPTPYAAGGGGQSPVRHLGDGTQVPLGVPGSTAGGEPPRWDTPVVNGYQGGLHDLSGPHPEGGGTWPSGQLGTEAPEGAMFSGDDAVGHSDRGAWGVQGKAHYPTKTKVEVHYRPGSDARHCGNCVMFHPASGTCDLVVGKIYPRGVCDEWEAKPAEKAATAPIAAGIAVVAADTGRVLLLQRAVDPADPRSGLWELPGGKLEPGEAPRDAALREWQEETGLVLPVGAWGGEWTSEDGVYHGYVYHVAREADVPALGPRNQVDNPDVAKVGPHGYVHGWIKVGAGVDSAHLGLKKTGEVKHKATGEVIGHVQRLENTPTKGTTTFITHHANGDKVYEGPYKREALAAVAQHHNQVVREHPAVEHSTTTTTTVAESNPAPAPEAKPEVKPEPTDDATAGPRRLLAEYERGHTLEEKLSGGNQALSVERVRLANGDQAVVKEASPKEVTKEYLSGLIANAVGLRDVNVAKLNDQTLLMSYLPGVSGNKMMNQAADRAVHEAPGHMFTGHKAVQEIRLRGVHDHLTQLGEAKNAREIALLDLLIDNPDRHGLNWIVADEGKTVYPIDHSSAQFGRGIHHGDLLKDKPNQVWLESPFSRVAFGKKGLGKGQLDAYRASMSTLNQPFTKNELVNIRERVAALRGEFDAAGLGDHLDYPLRRLDQMIKAAKT